MFYCDLLFQNKLSSTVSLVILGLQLATMRGTDSLHMTATINHLCFEDFECLNIMSPISSQMQEKFLLTPSRNSPQCGDQWKALVR